MIKACVIGLSKIGQIHCENLLKMRKTQLSFVYDKNSKLCKKYSKKYKCKTSKNFNKILKYKDIKLFLNLDNSIIIRIRKSNNTKININFLLKMI